MSHLPNLGTKLFRIRHTTERLDLDGAIEGRRDACEDSPFVAIKDRHCALLKSRRRPQPKDNLSPRAKILAELRTSGGTLGFQLSLDTSTASYASVPRLLDGLFDALETFWSGPTINFTIICRADQAQTIAADLISVPRLNLVFIAQETLEARHRKLVASVEEPLRSRLLALVAAAGAQTNLTLALSADTFPLRPFSIKALVSACASDLILGYSATSEEHAFGPTALFVKSLAEAAVGDLDILEAAAGGAIATPAVRGSLRKAIAAAELGFWQHPDGNGRYPLEVVDVSDWLDRSQKGWSPQPWKTSSGPYFVRITGVRDADAERVLPHVYGAFDR